MPLDSRKVFEKIREGSLGSLGGCLVEGNPEQRRGERRLRRRALALSIVIQTAVLASLISLSLFGKTEHLALAIPTPIPPYSPYTDSTPDRGVSHPHRQQRSDCHFCIRPDIPHIIVTHDTATSDERANDAPQGLGLGIPGAPAGLIPIPDARSPVPPPPVEHHVARPTVVQRTHLDPAMLIYRVDPIYPALPKQIHKEGRVELHARIATDGSIQSLEVVDGDPMFFQSALEAVRQWRYRPTILNGQPVEIDTHITVIYTMPH
ncbi:MAG TPA: energy transducer TonB [Candidatus Acidoferrum sp.]|jgi:protein TonB|nr:energy transducer TonB [Candidatus Acidoferrum sp.]